MPGTRTVTLTPVLLIGSSLALYTVEYFWHFEYVAAIMASVLLTVGLTIGLASANVRVSVSLVVAAGLSSVIAWLCRTAKRARLNKIHDL